MPRSFSLRSGSNRSTRETLTETGSVTPKPGDLIVYSWSDRGAIDNDNFSRHIGVVEYCDGDLIVAIEGNRINDVGRRVIPVDGKYIRGFGVPRYEELDEEG